MCPVGAAVRAVVRMPADTARQWPVPLVVIAEARNHFAPVVAAVVAAVVVANPSTVEHPAKRVGVEAVDDFVDDSVVANSHSKLRHRERWQVALKRPELHWQR